MLTITPGERIPTTSNIATELGVGFGTVERAIAALRDEGVIQTRARGQMGTLLLARDLARQWEIAGLKTVIALLPLPNAMTFMGLATGTTDWLEATGIPFSINFKNGAASRLMALTQRRADMISLSKRSANMACREHPELAAVAELPAWSYYGGHEIVFRHDAPPDRGAWRIGVDATSFDHVALCAELFPDAPTTEVRYVNLAHAIAKGEIDASLLHSRSMIPMEIATALATETVASSDTVLRDASAAVFLAHRDNAALRAVIEAAPDPVMIHEVQEAVGQGTREPTY